MPSSWIKRPLFILGIIFSLYICLEAYGFDYKQPQEEKAEEPERPLSYLPKYGPVPLRFSLPIKTFDRLNLIALEEVNLEPEIRPTPPPQQAEALPLASEPIPFSLIGQTPQTQPTAAPMASTESFTVEAGADPQPSAVNVNVAPAGTAQAIATPETGYNSADDLLLLFQKEIPKGKKTDEKIEVNFAVPNYNTVQPLNSPTVPSKATYRRR
tara:strand:- start:36224 stop:36859 length:636 start_codon:yes stop_codon:yes gene_type:complete